MLTKQTGCARVAGDTTTYSYCWFDSANYGTNGGAVLARPDVVPEGGDTVLVSTTRYKDDGEADAAIDPNGIETRWEKDAAGRRVHLIENYKKLCWGQKTLAVAFKR